MMIDLKHGEPIRFGPDGATGVVMGSDGQLRLVDVADVGEDAILVHDAHRHDPSLAFALARLSHDDHSPTPFGIFRSIERPDYGTAVGAQLAAAAEKKGPGDLARPAPFERHLDGDARHVIDSDVARPGRNRGVSRSSDQVRRDAVPRMAVEAVTSDCAGAKMPASHEWEPPPCSLRTLSSSPCCCCFC